MITVTFDPRFQVWQVALPRPKGGLRLPTLGHVFVHPAGYLLATDNIVGVLVRCQVEGAPKDWEGALIPADFLAKVAKAATRGEARVTVDGNDVRAETRDAILRTEAGTGPYRPLLKLFAGTLGAEDAGGAFTPRFDPEAQRRLALALGADHVAQRWQREAGNAVLVYGCPDDEAFGLLMPSNPEHPTAPAVREEALRAALVACGMTGEEGR